MRLRPYLSRHIRFALSALLTLLPQFTLVHAEDVPYSAFVQRFHSLERIPPNSAFVFKYVLPNEVNPELAKPILIQAPVGAYITVGTERAFMSAGMNPNANYLFVVDRDPSVILYNKINTALLQGSWTSGKNVQEMRADYLELRLKGTLNDWERALHGKLPPAEITEYFTWWNKNVQNSNSKVLQLFHTPPLEHEGTAFHGANYLFDDELFAKIQAMAVENRIQSIVMELGDPEVFDKFSALLAEAAIPLSVFDISNAWYEQYIGPKNFSRMLGVLEKDGRLSDESVILLTDHHNRIKSYSNGLPKSKPAFSSISSLEKGGFHDEYDWSYHGYHKKFLKNESKTGALEIGKRPKLNVSSLDADSLVLVEKTSKNWCRRIMTTIGFFPR